MAVNDFSEEASTPATPTTGRWKLYPKSTGWFFLDDAGVETPLTSTSVSTSPPVRQTCELGPVDTSGFAAFGGSTGSTTVTASGTLKVTAANGISDYRGSITNPSWTSLSTNGTMYLYLDIAADGTCTTGSTTLAPTYRWGGADVVTSGQFTFNIQEMVGKVGNGATAAQTYRVFVGEVTVSGNVVTAIIWYALMDRYTIDNTSITTATSYTYSHNIGKDLLNIRLLLANASYGWTEPRHIYLAGDLGQVAGDILRNTLKIGLIDLYFTEPATRSVVLGTKFRVIANRSW